MSENSTKCAQASNCAFNIVGLANMMLLMTGVLTTPLYRLYAGLYGLSPLDITLIYAAYAIESSQPSSSSDPSVTN